MIDPHHHLWDLRSQPKGWPIPAPAIRLLYSLRPKVVLSLVNASLRKSQPEVRHSPGPGCTSAHRRDVATHVRCLQVLNTFSEFNPFVTPYMAGELLRDISNSPQGGPQAPTVEIELVELGEGGTEFRTVPSRKGHNVVHTVYVECGWADPIAKTAAMQAVGETSMAQAVADATNNRLCTGIVGFVDLRLDSEQVCGLFSALSWTVAELCLEYTRSRQKVCVVLRHSRAW